MYPSDLGASVMKMLADTRGIKISDADKRELTEKFSIMPPYPEVPGALRKLHGARFRLFTLTVFTGAGRRRKWSDEDKARIVADIVTSGDSVCSVARRHGLSPQQLFGWRRQLREAAGGHSEIEISR